MCHDGNWVEVISWLKRQVWVVADWSGEKDDSALKNQTHTRKERYRQAFEKRHKCNVLRRERKNGKECRERTIEREKYEKFKNGKKK